MSYESGRATLPYAGARVERKAGVRGHRIGMSRILLLPSTCAAVMFCAALFIMAPQARAEEVNIPDTNLEAALRSALGIPSDPLQDTDLATLIIFNASSLAIADLTGLEYCTALRELGLASNQIIDLTPLTGLSSLNYIDLTGNQIFDVTPLEGISNLSFLILDSNRVVDVTPLADLPRLEFLGLSGNPVCDLESLVIGTGLEAGALLVVGNTPLTMTACATQIPALEARGVTVNSGTSCDGGGVEKCGVAIPDLNLEAALRSAVGIPTAPLLDTDLASLTLLNASALDIADLTGLEFCTGLTSLALASNEIVDLTPLEGLSALANIDLSSNQIADATPLGGLTALTSVDLSSNQIAEATPLAGLTNLESLALDNNLICDLAPLVDNTGLATGDSVVVLGNPLIAIACATQIPALTGRGVTVDSGAACDSGGFANCWIDIPDPNLEAALRTTLGIPTAPLQDTDLALVTIFSAFDRGIVNLTGLEYCTNLTSLFLFANEVVDLTPLAGLTSLTALELLDNQVTDVTPLAGLTNLTTLGLGDNKITDVSPLAGLTNLSFLSLVANQICDLTPLVDNAGLATGDSVFVGVNPLLAVACGTQIPALTGRGVTVDASTACDSGGETYCLIETVSIPDPNLEAALRASLGIPSAPLTYGDLANVTNFFAGANKDIVDLTGLEYCTNLTSLTLNNNAITDLSPLAGLTDLTNLYLGSNEITDLSPLAGLTNLTNVGLEFNQIADLTPLSGLASLTDVNIYNNQIVDLTPLSGLTTLDELDLSNNQIVDATPLSGLTNITYISLDGNQVSSIAPLSGLTALTLLELRNNQVSDLSPLTGLISLEGLALTGNPVADVTPLTGLASLDYLLLDGTLLCDLAPLVASAGLGAGSFVSVEGNSLSADSCANQIPALTGRGVTVESGTACDGGGVAECPDSGEGEGTVEGEEEGVAEGEEEGIVEGDGEGIAEGEEEGIVEGDGEGVAEGEGEGTVEGDGEGVAEGEGEGEGVAEGEEEGQLSDIYEDLLYTFASADSDANGRVTLAEILLQLAGFTQQNFDTADANDDGFLSVAELLELSSAQVILSADTSGDYVLSISELLRAVQLYNAEGYDCAANPGATEDGFEPGVVSGAPVCVLHGLDRNGDKRISLSELLRGIQLFSFVGYTFCDGQSEDDFCDRP
jgi:internalin A